MALFVLCGLTACAAVRQAGDADDLDHVVDLYWRAAHWKDAVAGSAFVYFDQRSEWLKVREKRAKDLDITSNEVEGEKIDKDQKAGTVLVKVTWYLLPSIVEQTEIVEQRWISDHGHWLLMSEKNGPLPFP